MKRVPSRAIPDSIPAPVGGWNARDSLGEMKPLDAVYLKNMFPATTDVVLRYGYTNHATGLGSQVETIMAYANGTTSKLFAIAGSSLWDVTSGGAVGAASVTGLSNARWQYVNMSTPGGNFLLAFNGADNGLRYDGTKWVAVPISTGVAISSGSGTGAVCTLNVTAHGLLTGNTITVTGCSDVGYNQSDVTITVVDANSFTYAGTGTGSTAGGSYTVAEGISIDPKNIIGVVLHKNRVWLTPSNSLVPYYLGTNSIAGSATAFPIQSIAEKGGYVMALGSWTYGVGASIEELLSMVTSEGEVIVYSGDDPASSSTWRLSGIWAIGRPIGRRCLQRYGSEMLLISQDGLLPMSSIVQSAQLNESSVALSNKIMYAVSQAVSIYGANFGWQVIYFPRENMLIVNVPLSVGQQEQYVMNTISKSWCNFTGWAANCWEMYQDNPYFGGNGIVAKAWNGLSDNGSNIVADAKQAFNYYKSPGILKRFTMIRPIISTNGFPTIAAGLNLDFDDSDVVGSIGYSHSSSGIWDTSLWDNGTWGGDLSIQKQWQGVTGIGYCAATRMKIAAQGLEVRWISTDIVMERGAIL